MQADEVVLADEQRLVGDEHQPFLLVVPVINSVGTKMSHLRAHGLAAVRAFGSRSGPGVPPPRSWPRLLGQ